MTRKQKHDDDDDDDDASNRKRVKTCDKGGGTHLNHDMLYLVMMRLGVVDFVSFSGVCKSWRSLALSNRKRFMVSKPPMCINYSSSGRYCCLEDFEGRKLKIILPHIADRLFVGVTCGYLVFVSWNTKDFLLVNPITTHKLHFPAFPKPLSSYIYKAILVFSPSINGWVLVVSRTQTYDLWFSISGEGSWNCVPSSLEVLDIHAFKEKIYTLNTDYQVCELRLNQEPRLTLLEIKNFPERYVNAPVFISSGENLYAMDQTSLDLSKFQKLDFDKMKWVSPEKKTIGDYVFFRSTWNSDVAIRSESWAWAAEPPSKYKSVLSESLLDDTIRKGGLFVANMWYFPHQCLDVDLIN